MFRLFVYYICCGLCLTFDRVKRLCWSSQNFNLQILNNHSQFLVCPAKEIGRYIQTGCTAVTTTGDPILWTSPRKRRGWSTSWGNLQREIHTSTGECTGAPQYWKSNLDNPERWNKATGNFVTCCQAFAKGAIGCRFYSLDLQCFLNPNCFRKEGSWAGRESHSCEFDMIYSGRFYSAWFILAETRQREGRFSLRLVEKSP